MIFENFLEGLEILNSCLVTNLVFEQAYARVTLHKMPTKLQQIRLKSLGWSENGLYGYKFLEGRKDENT